MKKNSHDAANVSMIGAAAAAGSCYGLFVRGPTGRLGSKSKTSFVMVDAIEPAMEYRFREPRQRCDYPCFRNVWHTPAHAPSHRKGKGRTQPGEAATSNKHDDTTTLLQNNRRYHRLLSLSSTSIPIPTTTPLIVASKQSSKQSKRVWNEPTTRSVSVVVVVAQ